MTRDEALELLPLFACDELAPGEREAVRTAIAGDAEAEELLRSFRRLDGWLAEAFPAPAAPAWLADPNTASAPRAPAAAEPDAPGDPRRSGGFASEFAADADPEPSTAEPSAAGAPAPLVRRRCPYCHDALGTACVVFCTGCATPHHADCFSENHGCALLGCGGTASVGTREAASRLCGSCQGHTPARAPFCAWCGAALGEGEGAEPRHHRAPAAERAPRGLDLGTLRNYLAAAALLLACGLGVGALFGRRERPVLEAMRQQGWQLLRLRWEEQARQNLQEVLRAQRRYAREDLDGNGVRDYAPSLASLDEALRRAGWCGTPAAEESCSGTVVYGVPPWAGGRVRIELRAAGQGEDARFVAVARPNDAERAEWSRRVNAWGEAVPPRAQRIDQTGSLRAVGEKEDPFADLGPSTPDPTGDPQ
ncbi:MAG: hypothetical protein D6731_16800 [Planctomycetota bacterium]|nr:MAG: hypothetical protein D6731_16800 [Planctomycetota bacterium]